MKEERFYRPATCQLASLRSDLGLKSPRERIKAARFLSTWKAEFCCLKKKGNFNLNRVGLVCCSSDIAGDSIHQSLMSHWNTSIPQYFATFEYFNPTILHVTFEPFYSTILDFTFEYFDPTILDVTFEYSNPKIFNEHSHSLLNRRCHLQNDELNEKILQSL